MRYFDQNNRRAARRIRVKNFSGRLRTLHNDRKIDCLFHDVSAGGIGIFSSSEISPDTQVVLELDDHCEVTLETKWCQPVENQQASAFRYGFRLCELGVDLARLFIDRGWANLRILIVDDEPYLLDLYELVFTKMNFEVFRAKDGESAINVIKEEDLDVVLTDFMMPNGGGAVVVAAARKNDLPVGVITAASPSHLKSLLNFVPTFEKLSLSSKYMIDT